MQWPLSALAPREEAGAALAVAERHQNSPAWDRRCRRQLGHHQLDQRRGAPLDGASRPVGVGQEVTMDG